VARGLRVVAELLLQLYVDLDVDSVQTIDGVLLQQAPAVGVRATALKKQLQLLMFRKYGQFLIYRLLYLEFDCANLVRGQTARWIQLVHINDCRRRVDR